MSNTRFPMIITCVVKNTLKLTKVFERLLRKAGYIQIGEKFYIHSGGEQLTAAISTTKTCFIENDNIKECLALFLSDAEHAINLELCSDLNKFLSRESPDI